MRYIKWFLIAAVTFQLLLSSCAYQQQSPYTTYTPTYSTQQTAFNESTFKEYLDANTPQPYEGVYAQVIGDNNYRLAVKKESTTGQYRFIYLSGGPSNWRTGEIKALYEPTAEARVFVGKWHMQDKSISKSTALINDNSTITVYLSNEFVAKEFLYIKVYPTTSNERNASQTVKTGTGFLISSQGFVVTNHHVIENATSIKIKGGYLGMAALDATVAITDRNNDLCLLKVDLPTVSSLTPIAYGFDDALAKAGESVFCMGYPLTPLMGSEIKTTNGIISSSTGYQGDVSTYQVSSPVQPGNSGGPLINESGNVIGIINAKIPGAENVTYAVKLSYLHNLIALLEQNIQLTKKEMKTISLADKIELFKKTIFIVEVQ